MSNFTPNHDDLLFCPLGGANEIGMNVNLYHYRGKWLVVDCGSGFTDGTVPGADMVVADLSFIQQHRHNIVGLFLTHAHEDHAGGIQYLFDVLACPIYTTKFTANFLRRRLEEYPEAQAVKIVEIESGAKINLDPFVIEAISLTHSAPEMQAIVIRTAIGNILHTGDWKLDHDPLIGQVSDEELLKKYGEEGILALVCDSTNVFNPGRSGSEGDLRKSMIEIVRKCKNLVVVATFASNLARLDTIIHAAEASGRRVVAAGRSMHRMIEIAQESGYLRGIKELISEENISNWKREEILVLSTGCQGEAQAAVARMAENNHPIRLTKDDTVIFSSKIIPGNERKIYNLFNTLIRRDIEVITERDHFVHVSGHPALEELKLMYELTRPRVAVPVHGEPVHLREHVKLAKLWGTKHAVEVQNGNIVNLNPNNPMVIANVRSGYQAIDGRRLLPISSPIFKARRKLSQGGIIVITLPCSPANQGYRSKLATKPIINAIGCFDADKDEQLLDDIFLQVKDKFYQYNNKLYDHEKMAGNIKRQLQQMIKRTLGKEPLIVVNVAEISGQRSRTGSYIKQRERDLT